MMRRMLSVVIPAYNEEETLPAHLARLAPVLERVGAGGWEVLVVDDGSTDRTAAVVEGLGLSPRVRLVRAPVNRGKGAALRLGVGATTGELVLTCDADMATPPETLLPFVEALRGGADVVIGNRRDPAAAIERPQTWLRRTLGSGYLALCRWMTGVRLQDYNCGFKLFRGAVAREVMASTTTDGWAIDMESLALAVRQGRRVVELPVAWRAGDGTTVRLYRDVAATLAEMVRIWWRLRRP
jgi:dolichyl-phosphate beta-glucosyltransferase